jgi:hypothetical protein
MLYEVGCTYNVVALSLYTRLGTIYIEWPFFKGYPSSLKPLLF